MDVDLTTLLVAFGLTLFAGLATGIGSFLAFFAKRTNTRILSVALGFSAGVMIYVSFVEIFFKTKTCLVDELGLHIVGRVAAVGKGIRRTPPVALWSDNRHDRNGDKPGFLCVANIHYT